MYNTLITLLDRHNESILILADKYKIKNIKILERHPQNIEFKETIKDTLERNLDSVVEFIEINDLKSQIINLIEENSLINLTGGKRIDSLELLKLSLDLNIDNVYVDILNKKEYFLGNNRINKIEDIDLDIEDILNSGGNNLLQNSSEISKNKYVIKYTEYIYENMDIWNKYKQILYDNSIFEHQYKNPKHLTIHKEKLEGFELKLLNKILNILEEDKQISCKNTDRGLVVEFLNNYLKGFIFKSGTWLEVFTENIVKEIQGVDDVQSGLVFIWNKYHTVVRNELDVVAVKDSSMTCISCKDSEKYDEEALNELSIYSERIGGVRANKILVATKPPSKQTIIERANEMGINIVILGRNKTKFKNELNKIINNIKRS